MPTRITVEHNDSDCPMPLPIANRRHWVVFIQEAARKIRATPNREKFSSLRLLVMGGG
jgi:hypothetical protein